MRFCSPCRKARQRAQIRAWNKANKARKLELQRNGKFARKWELAKFGLTLDDFDEMVSSRAGRCDICNEESTLCLDHDHVTGEVRGLLCRKCNRALGLLGDSIDGLATAVAYLEMTRA